MDLSQLDEELLFRFDPGELAVLKTVAYADIFDFPLTLNEITAYLIAPLRVDRQVLAAKTAGLVAQGYLGTRDGFYFLPGGEELPDRRRRRLSAAPVKWRKAGRWGRLLKILPWIRMVGVSGALAMDNSEAEDDIDLVIVTAARRVWLTRFFVVLLFWLTGQYRRPERTRNRFCPNLFVSENALDGFRRNLYVAHEVVQLRLLWSRGDTYLRFLAVNSWLNNFLPHVALPPRPVVGGARPEGGWLDRLETLLMKAQLRHMAAKKTIEVTTEDAILLHPRDTTRQVLEALSLRLQRWL